MKKVTIVGGGVAGMATALRLLEQGIQVTIFESTDSLGGKAGAIKNNKDYDEHGYHLFPGWYLNFWKIIDEINITGNFTPCLDYTQLERNDFPNYKTFKNLVSLKYFFRNLFSGILSPAEMYLLAFFAVDLMSAPMSEKAFLDQVTLNGFMRSRFYRSEELALKCQDFILNGVSTPSYLVSAMTMKILLNFWTKYPTPTFSILNGNLQEFLIEPFQKKLVSLGCEINMNSKLDRVEIGDKEDFRLFFNEGSPNATVVTAEKLLLSLPAEKITALFPDKTYGVAPDLFKLRYLVAKPMASLNIYFNKKYDNIANSHIILLESKFHISFIDVSQHWKGYENTVFNMICSDLTLLIPFKDDTIIEMVIKELKDYFPFIKDGDIDHVVFQNNYVSPILTNQVGSWPNRPYNTTQVPNLFLAGDFTKTHVDLVCVEGAIVSGLHAFNDIMDSWGDPHKTNVLEPKVYPVWLLRIAKLFMFPFAVLCKFILLFSKKARAKK